MKRLLAVMLLAIMGLFVTLIGISSPRFVTASPSMPQEYKTTRQVLNFSPAPTSDWQNDGATAGDYFGTAVAMADIDEDGAPDYVVGAPNHDNNMGAVYIYASNSDASPGITPTHVITPGSAGAEFGYAVDVLMVQSDSNAFYLFVGAPGYLGNGAVFVYQVTGSSYNFVTKILGTTNGGNIGERFGETLATVYMDYPGSYAGVFVGAPLYDDHSSNLIDIGRVAFYSSTQIYNPVDLDANFDWQALGDNPNSDFGKSIEAYYETFAGTPIELAIGAHGRDSNGLSNNGAVSIYEIDPTATLPMTPSHFFEGTQDEGRFGHSLLFMDADGDGIRDILIGEPKYTNDAGEIVGRVYVETDYNTAAPPRAIQADFDLVGEEDGGLFGYTLGAASLNSAYNCGDDLLVGSPSYSFASSGEGAIFAYANRYVSPSCALDLSPYMLYAGNTDSARLGTSIAGGVGVGGYFDSRATSVIRAAALFGVPEANNGAGAAIAYDGYRTDIAPSGFELVAPTVVGTGVPNPFVSSIFTGAAHLYWWDMGDGSEYIIFGDDVSVPANLTHAYQTSGTYTVTVQVMSPNAAPLKKSQAISVLDPITSLNVTVADVEEGSPSEFVATTETGSDISYFVLFGDETGKIRMVDDVQNSGTYYTGIDAGQFVFTHTYPASGIYDYQVVAFNSVSVFTSTGQALVYDSVVITPGVGSEISVEITGSVKITVEIPGDAVDEVVTLQITPIEDGCGDDVPAPADLIGNCFDIEAVAGDVRGPISSANTIYCVYLPFLTTNGMSNGASGIAITPPSCGPVTDEYQFLVPITLSLAYDDTEIPSGFDENDLIVEFYDTTVSSWMDGATTCSTPSTYVRDTVLNVISVEICHQSRWAFGR